MNKFDVYIDVHRYIRKLSIKKYFLSNNHEVRNTKAIDTVGIDSGLKNRSIFNPPQPANHQVEVFKQLILKDLDLLPVNKPLNPQYITEDNLIRTPPMDRGRASLI